MHDEKRIITARELSVKVLYQFDRDGGLIDHIMMGHFARVHLSDVDKRLANELINGTLRWRIKIDWILKQLYLGNLGKIPSRVLIALEVSVYQLLRLDKVPDYAIVNEAVRLTKKSSGRYWGNVVNAILRTFIRERESLEATISELPLKQAISINYAHPEWMIDRWVDRYGEEETKALCSYNNRSPVTSIRINSLKIDRDSFLEMLRADGVDCEPGLYLNDFIRLHRLPDLTRYYYFLEGYFTVQDESAGLVARLIDPKPEEALLDLCAAPGGKTTYIAELESRSDIYAVDLYYKRLKMIRENSTRLSLKNIRLICSDATYFRGVGFDKVLVDAPCSGLGVLSKRSDLRLQRKEKQLFGLSNLQYRILENAAGLIRTEGTLVYSTCTIERDENEGVIERFLNKHPEFQISPPDPQVIPEEFIVNHCFIKTLPHKHDIDGTFSVKLLKVT